MTPLLRLSLMTTAGAIFFALVSTLQTYIPMLTHGHSFLRMFAWQLGCWSIWALAAPWVIRRTSRWGVVRIVVVGLGLSVVQGLVAALMTVWLQPFVPVESYSYTQALFIAWPYRVVVSPLVYGLLVVGGSAFAAYERARALELRETQLEAEVTRAQLAALRLEIQPHFLFNTLNGIAALVRARDNDAALAMVVGLSEMMRSTLDRPGGQLLPLADELALVRRYVDLQRMRFGDRLDVTFNVDSACEQVAVPAFVLQPIVENALRHGLADARFCRLEIGATPHNAGDLRVWVSDNGRGLPLGFDAQRDAGTGLSNITTRIARLYGSAASLTLRANVPAGTMVELILPRVTVPMQVPA